MNYPVLVPGPRIEVGTGKPGYRWVDGWCVRYSPERISQPLQLHEARALLAEAKK